MDSNMDVSIYLLNLYEDINEHINQIKNLEEK